MSKLTIRPITLRASNAFVTEKHRHHKADRGHKFSVALYDADELVGVAICGRPKSRVLDGKGDVLEVTRLCSDGTKNACSMLYGASARIAREMGYAAILTYTLETEPGTSLRASGWVSEGVVRRDGKGWNNRAGRENLNPERKVRWLKTLGSGKVNSLAKIRAELAGEAKPIPFSPEGLAALEELKKRVKE